MIDRFRSFARRQRSLLETAFTRWGNIVYNYPLPIILLSLLLFVACIFGLNAYSVNRDWKSLWVPKDSEGRKNYDTVRELYDSNTINLDIILVPKEPLISVISVDVFNSILDFDTQMQSEVSVDDLHYIDLCYRPRSTSFCQTKNHPLDFFKTVQGSYDLSGVHTDTELLQAIQTGKSELFQYLDVNSIFGGTTPEHVSINTDGINNIQSAKSIKWSYLLFQKGISEDNLRKFIKNVENFIIQLNKDSQFVELEALSITLLYEALEQTTEVAHLLAISVVVLLTYVICTLGSTNTYESRVLCAIVGILNVGVAYVECLAVGSWLGIQGNLSIAALPFVMLGIGMDDMYILISELNLAPEEGGPKGKMEHMMRYAGLSITVTSVTNIFSFLSGSLTSIESLKNFCLFGALGILFTYLNQVTFYCAVVALDLRRSDKNKGDCCGLISCSPTSKICCYGKFNTHPDGTKRQNLSTILCRDVYGRLLSNDISKRVILILCGLLFLTNIFGLSLLNIDLAPAGTVPSGSPVKRAIELNDLYFTTTGFPLNFYSVHSDFASEEVQTELLDLEIAISDCKGCKEPWVLEHSTHSWYSYLKAWIKRGECLEDTEEIQMQGNFIPPEKFMYCLSHWLASSDSLMFESMFAWDEELNLTAAAIQTSVTREFSSENRMQEVTDAREIAKTGPQSTFPFNLSFLWYEQFFVFTYEAFICLSSSILAVFVIVLLMLTDFIAGLLIFAMVILTLLGQLAVLSFSDESLNVATISATVMSIGIAVDYNIHFYIASSTVSEDSGILKAFEKVGAGIFHGGFTTILAILPLMLDDTFIVRIFLKSWVAIIAYSFFHGMAVLPVLLSLRSRRKEQVEFIEME